MTKVSKNLVAEFTKTFAAIRQASGLTREQIIKDAQVINNTIIRKTINSPAYKQADSAGKQALLAASEARNVALEEAKRKYGLFQVGAIKEEAKITQQARADYLNSRQGQIDTIATQWGAADVARRKYTEGLNTTKQEYQALLASHKQALSAKHFTPSELAKMVKLTKGAREFEAKHLITGKETVGSGGIAPSSAARRGLQNTITDIRREIGKLMGTPIPAIEKMKAFYADSAKYATFQLRWFASASTIFAVTGAISSATQATFKFYQSLKDIQAVTGASEAGIKLISNAAIEVAKNTPIAASSATQMGLKLIQAGLDANQAAEAMKTVAAIVTVSGEGMAESSKAVTTAMFAWHIPAKEIPKIGQTIAGALNFSRLTVEDLGTAFNYLAATSSIMNHSLEATTANMATLSNMGIRASTIGTALSHAYSELINPSKEFSKWLAHAGVTADQINPSLHSFADIIEILTNKGLAATQAFKMFGDRAGRIMASALIAGSGAFRKMEKDISESTQLTTGLATAMEGPTKALARLRNQFEVSFIQIGAVGVPVIQLFTDMLTNMMWVVRKLTEGIAVLAQQFGSTVTALMVIIPVISLFVYRSLPAMYTGLSGIAAGLKAVTWSTLSLNTVLKATPWWLIATVAVSAVGLLASYFSKAGQNAESLAQSEEKLSAIRERRKQQERELLEASNRQEVVYTRLKEIWDRSEYAKSTVRFPFEDKITVETLNITKYGNEIGTLQEKLEALYTTIKKMKEDEDKGGWFGNLMGTTKDYWSNIFTRFKYGGSLGPAPSAKQEEIDAQRKAIEAEMADIEQMMKESQQKTLLMIAQTPMSSMRSQIEKSLAEKRKESATDRQQGLVDKITNEYKNAIKPFEGMSVDKIKEWGDTHPQQMKGIIQLWHDLWAAVQRLSDEHIFQNDKALEKYTDELNKLKDALKEAERNVKSLQDELDDLIEKDPFVKIDKKYRNKQNELQTKIDEYNSNIQKLASKTGRSAEEKQQDQTKISVYIKLIKELGESQDKLGKIGKTEVNNTWFTLGEKWKEDLKKIEDGAEASTRALEALRQEYEDLVNHSPYLKIHRKKTEMDKGLAREEDETEKDRANILKELEKYHVKITTDLTTGLSLVERGALSSFGDEATQAAADKAIAQLTEGLIKLDNKLVDIGKRKGVVTDVVREMLKQEATEQAKKASGLYKDEALIALEFKEQMLSLRKTYEGLTGRQALQFSRASGFDRRRWDTLGALEEEIGLSKERAKLEEDFLKTQKTQAEAGTDNLAIKQAELELLKFQYQQKLKNYELDKKRYEQVGWTEGGLLKSLGNLGDSFASGIEAYYNKIIPLYLRMRQLGENTAQSIQQGFSAAFYKIATMEGFDKEKYTSYWEFLKDVADDFLKSIYQSMMKMLADMWADLMMQLLKWIAIKAAMGLGYTAAPNTTTPNTTTAPTNTFAHTGGLIMHTGGVVPRYHNGGLSPDERLIIAQTGEMVINRKATSRNLNTLQDINNGKNTGGGGVTNIYNNIQTMDAKSFRDFGKRNEGVFAEMFARDMRKAGSSRTAVRAYQ